MFAKHRAAKQAEETAAARAELGRMLAVAEGGQRVDAPIVLRAGEEAIDTISGAGLFETRRGPGHWQGRSSGISVPVGGGIRIRTGASRGHYVQGAEAPTIIDTGTVTMTSQRVVFTGPRYTREWDFAKLIAVQHFENQPWTAIQVSNRQKTSGFIYKGQRIDFVRAWLDLALAVHAGERSSAAAQLRDQLAALAPEPVGAPQPEPGPPGARPSGSPAGVPSGPPADWYPDPAGVAPLRWWDGTQWTPYTAAAPGTAAAGEPA